MSPIDDDMTVPTYDTASTPAPAIELMSRARLLARARHTATAPAAEPISAATQRATRLGIRSGLANRAARLGIVSPVVPPDDDQEKLA